MSWSRRRLWLTLALGGLGGLAMLAGLAWAYVWAFPGEFACEDTAQYEVLHRETDALLDGIPMVHWCDTDGTSGPMLISEGSAPVGPKPSDVQAMEELRTTLDAAGWTRQDRYASCESFHKTSPDGIVFIDLCLYPGGMSVSVDLKN